MVRGYLEWLVELPWTVTTTDHLDLHEARRVLDEDHYGLEHVKERILEYLGVCKLKEQMKGPILCFVGPPGVGKTSLGQSIARALGRKFVRLSLGGIRDEAEIRGHRRTYVGALPGRILQSMHQAGSANPVFMLDEVDKLGADFRGDPAAALLEVLDPAQNHAFSDHYLGVPFDLSRVMFIATANLADPIPGALRDRMEIISLAGYSEHEKLHIARRYLLSRQLREHGLSPRHLRLSEAAIAHIIMAYTREAGVRNLERELATICRKIARKVAEGQEQTFHIHTGNVHRSLGMRKYLPEVEQQRDEIGVATSLAWTEAGGVVMHAEATVMDGTGQLLLTGSLGEVMKESAQAALSYTRARARDFRHLADGLPRMRSAYPCPGRGDPQRRSLGWYYACRRPHFGAHGYTSLSHSGHERRDHPARASPASGWGAGKSCWQRSGLACSVSCCRRAIARMSSTFPPSSAVVCASCSRAPWMMSWPWPWHPRATYGWQTKGRRTFYPTPPSPQSSPIGHCQVVGC